MKRHLSFNRKTEFIFIGILTIFILPILSIHAEGLVPDCGKVVDGVMSNPCNFNSVMELIKNVIHFLLFVIATPLAALAFCYAGFKLLTAGGSPEQITKAKHIIRNVIIGYVLALGAWLVVNTIFSTLGFKGNTFLKDQDIAKTEVIPPPVTTPVIPSIVQETPKEDSGVLYIGGSYTEENPSYTYTGQLSCSNPPSKLLVVNSYLWSIYKAYADDPEQQKAFDDAKDIANAIRQARCWLLLWYVNRSISDTNLMHILDSNSKRIVTNIQAMTFRIIDVEKHPNLSPCPGADACSLEMSSDRFELVVNYRPWNIQVLTTPDLYIHELNHASENNGRLIPQAETKKIESILPDNIMRGYYSDHYSKTFETTIGHDPIRFNYCYVYLGVDPPGNCYNFSGINTKTLLPIEYKYPSYGLILDNKLFYSRTELTARLMEVRHLRNFYPMKDVTWDQAWEMVDFSIFSTYSPDKEGEKEKYVFYGINADFTNDYYKYPEYHFFAQPDESKYGFTTASDEIVHLAEIAVLGDSYGCVPQSKAKLKPIGIKLKPKDIICYFKRRTNDMSDPEIYVFSSKEKAFEYFEIMVAKKILYLFNDTL